MLCIDIWFDPVNVLDLVEYHDAPLHWLIVQPQSWDGDTMHKMSQTNQRLLMSWLLILSHFYYWFKCKIYLECLISNLSTLDKCTLNCIVLVGDECLPVNKYTGEGGLFICTGIAWIRQGWQTDRPGGDRRHTNTPPPTERKQTLLIPSPLFFFISSWTDISWCLGKQWSGLTK